MGAASPPASAANEYTETTRARSQPKESEIGSRKTVKLSSRPRPSTDSAKHSASTFSAVRTGGFAVLSGPAESSSMASMERLFAAKNRWFARMPLCGAQQHVALFAKRQLDHALRGQVGSRQGHL